MTLPKLVLGKIEQEAKENYERWLNTDVFTPNDYYTYEAGATLWAERALALREALAKTECQYAPSGNYECIRCKAIQAFDEEMKKNE